MAPVAKKVVSPVVIYAQVASGKQQADLDRQVSRFESYCAGPWLCKMNQAEVVKEIGSRMNDSRRKFLALLSDPKAEHHCR